MLLNARVFVDNTMKSSRKMLDNSLINIGDKMDKKVVVIGAGLAGSESAYFLAQAGVDVVLYESKVLEKTPAQKLTTAAELVCTNSLKSLDPHSSHGLLKEEMKDFNSLILKLADEFKVPAGDALAVDRILFSEAVEKTLKAHPKIEWHDEIVGNPLELLEKHGASHVIVATGPLTLKPMEKWLTESLTKDDFYFYDAIAPVVDADTIDMSKMYFKDRHKAYPVDNEEENTPDYLNIPMNQEQYEAFIKELVAAEKVPAKDFEDYKFFESCLPVDTMAERGPETARFSCMKPIGLELPDGTLPHACVQLRRENLLGSAYNLVGFQTRLTYKEQLRVFKMLPGLEEASFIHLGSVHRNSFLNARKLLNFDLSSKEYPAVSFAGQITGVEGYTESSSMGLYVAFQVLRKLNGLAPLNFPPETAMGALVNYIMTAERPVPSSINAGLFPQVTLTKPERRDRKRIKKIKKEKIAIRAREVFTTLMESTK
jgi:methylenetetrahydrofolate--tRNA-(uracil-5-)-methyltransferase